MHSPRLRSMSSHAPHDGRVAGASPVDWIRSKRSLLAVVIGACIVLLVLVVSISQVSVWGLLPLMGTIKLPGALRRNRFEGPFWRNNQVCTGWRSGASSQEHVCGSLSFEFSVDRTRDSQSHCALPLRPLISLLAI